MSETGSHIFRLNRSLGYVSNQIPAIVRYIPRRKENLITTCIGRSFQTYSASHFRLMQVSDIHPDEITALAADRVFVFSASDKCIYAWRASKQLKHVYRGHTRNVHLLLPFGNHLIAVDEANILKVWDVRSEEVYLELPFNQDEFHITAIAHVPTYVNKILLGSMQGVLKLWNFKDNRLVYTFEKRKDSRIKCLISAPALDVVAIGYQNGEIILLNLKFDEIVMSFNQHWGDVTQISFRTDGVPIMATASTNGRIAFWNLEEKKIAHQLHAHEKSVTTAVCFPNEPLLLTTSPDNSMKLWIFDLTDGGGRVLRMREGHTKPLLCIRYHGSNGASILSSGEDRSMRVLSTISESLNKNMGKASFNPEASKKKKRFQYDDNKMPPIVEFTTETTREKEWDNIAARHSGMIQTTTWSFHKSKMGEHRLVPKKFHNVRRSDFETKTTCLILSCCGNYVIIGYGNGDVELFNMQSGIHRGSYGSPAHKSAVRGVASDNLNQIVVSGCGDGLLKFWEFKAKPTPLGVIKCEDGIELIRNHRESSLIAIALVNFDIIVVDLDTKKIIRKFQGHTSKINDMTFNPDSRWLITACMDTTIRVWDIPSSYMIDHFRTDRPCISLTFSPIGNFLATAHANSVGVYLWANKTLFSNISLRSVDPYEEAPYIDIVPTLGKEISIEDAVENMLIDDDGDAEDHTDDINFNYKSPEQLSDNLITMSGLAASRWQNLLDLELIRKRNKPKQPPKVPKQAPFFLPTIAGLELKFDTATAVNDDGDNSHLLQTKTFSNLTTFGRILEQTSKTGDFNECFTHLKQMGPSMIDFEIKSLHPLNGGTELIMIQFLKTIHFMFRSKTNFELAQSYLSVFLRAHGLNLVEMPKVINEIKLVSEEQENSWQQLESKFMFSMGVVSALRNFVH